MALHTRSIGCAYTKLPAPLSYGLTYNGEVCVGEGEGGQNIICEPILIITPLSPKAESSHAGFPPPSSSSLLNFTSLPGPCVPVSLHLLPERPIRQPGCGLPS